MATVTTPTGETFDETNPEALHYYLREPGFTVDADTSVEAAVVEALEQTVGVFDPGEHTVEDVLAYLDGASDAERERVLAAEEAGKARKGVLSEDAE